MTGLRPPVQATRYQGDILECKIPGAFYIDVNPLSFKCICPCGCGTFMSLHIYYDSTPKPAYTAWSFNGDLLKPTLDPSIRDLAGCHFHGWLRNGEWSFAADSNEGGKFLV